MRISILISGQRGFQFIEHWGVLALPMSIFGQTFSDKSLISLIFFNALCPDGAVELVHIKATQKIWWRLPPSPCQLSSWLPRRPNMDQWTYITAKVGVTQTVKGNSPCWRREMWQVQFFSQKLCVWMKTLHYSCPSDKRFYIWIYK